MNWAWGDISSETVDGPSGKITENFLRKSGMSMASRLCKAAMLSRFNLLAKEAKRDDLFKASTYQAAKTEIPLTVMARVLWNNMWIRQFIVYIKHLILKKTLENITLNKRVSQRTTYYIISFTWSVQNRQSYRHRKYIAGCLGLRGKGQWLPLGMGIHFGMKKISQKWTVIMDIQFWIFINHWIIQIEWVNCAVCKLCLNKAVTKKPNVLEGRMSLHWS